MKREERLAQLARLLLDAIEKAEQLAEPDIAEIVRDALQELEHPLNDLEDHPTQQQPLHDSETAAGESFPGD
jgi:hypothetical protein